MPGDSFPSRFYVIEAYESFSWHFSSMQFENAYRAIPFPFLSGEYDEQPRAFWPVGAAKEKRSASRFERSGRVLFRDSAAPSAPAARATASRTGFGLTLGSLRS